MMSEEKQNAYDRCVHEIRRAIAEWEKIRPEDELVVMVLPKYDPEARKERLKEICRMLLEERWRK